MSPHRLIYGEPERRASSKHGGNVRRGMMTAGRRAQFASLAAVALTAAAAWWFAHRDVPWVFFTGDEVEYAEVARRLASGRGFTTGIIYPIEVQWGVHDHHPSLLRAPLWPLLEATVFLATGPGEVPVLATTMACHVATSMLVFALAGSLAGLPAGLVAGLAAATSPDVVGFAQVGASETFFGLWVALFFVAIARRVDGWWVGVVCGLAYLTRYNGGLLLVAGLLLQLRRPLPVAALLRCVAGFVAIAAPWWVRNFLVTGNPVYSLYSVTLYFTPDLIPPNASLIYMIEPDLASQAAMAPLEKLWVLLPDAIAHWPLASANLVACIGLLLGCARRDRGSLALFGVAAGTTVLISTMALRGRYLVPFVPAMIGLGTAGWLRFGGRLGPPAAALVLVVPLIPGLPRVPAPLYDIALTHEFLAQTRDAVRSGARPDSDAADRFAACVTDHPMVIAHNAPPLNWAADTVAIHMTRTEADFWRLVDEHPIEYVRLRPDHHLNEAPRFLARFDAAPECGPGVYRRSAADSSVARPAISSIAWR